MNPSAETGLDFSVIIPCLNEQDHLRQTLDSIHNAMHGHACEIIVVDGGSTDNSHAVWLNFQQNSLNPPLYVLACDAGRALQMNTGAKRARGRILWFVHADTRAPENAAELMQSAINATPHKTIQKTAHKTWHEKRHEKRKETRKGAGKQWGRFDVRLDSHQLWAKAVAFFMNKRSCWSGIATGDQAIFIERRTFEHVGGFPRQPLMEDIEISKRLLAHDFLPACLKSPVQTSARRWQKNGVIKTVLLMWSLRWQYWRGVSAEDIHQQYYGGASND